MQTVADRPEAPTAIRTDLGAIFVSLELSRSTWLITSLSPGGGEKMSKQVVRGGDVAGLLERFARLREKARARTGKVFPFVVIQEAGLDGFWIDRALQNEGIESHVVDPASIATSRRRRRAKTDGIDGEALVRALLAYKRGEPRVCAMVKAPTPEEEDRRRLCRERKVLIGERVQHVNRLKGLLFSQGISGYEPLRRDRRERLDTLQTQRNKSQRRRRRRCCSISRASGRSSPPSSGRKGSSDTSTIDAKSLLMLCAASRNLRPPNLTNGILRRASSSSS
jgi:transposase